MERRTETLVRAKGSLLTPNEDMGFTEYLKTFKGEKYREWDPTRSKWAAALTKGAQIPLKQHSSVLYLGAAHGYTISFLSQLTQGKIYGIEFAPRVARELIIFAKKRKNVFPIVADANQPSQYFHLVEPCDIVFQDVAQRNQVEIFIKNCQLFLKKDGIGILALKSRSVDVTKKPGEIYADVKKQLEAQMKVLDFRKLEPLQRDHALFIVRKR